MKDRIDSKNKGQSVSVIPVGSNNPASVGGEFQNREVVASLTSNPKDKNYFTSEIVLFEMRKHIFSFAVDESFVKLSRVCWFLNRGIKQFMKETLVANYDSENFYFPFKNKFADFNNQNLGIAITYFCYSWYNAKEHPSCKKYKELFLNYFCVLHNSWIECGFFAKSGTGYDLTINGKVIQLSKRDNASIFLLRSFLPRYMRCSLIPYIESKEKEVENTLNSVLKEKRELLSYLYQFGEPYGFSESKFQEKFPHTNLALIDMWCIGGFQFNKSSSSFMFSFTEQCYEIDESPDFIVHLTEFFYRFFLSRKIISDHGQRKRDAIDFFALHKSNPAVSNIITNLIFYFFEQCHYDPDQPFWLEILAHFISKDLIDAGKALPLKKYALTRLENVSSCLRMQFGILNLLNNLLIKNLVNVDENDAKTLVTDVLYMLKNLENPLNLLIQTKALELLNFILVKNIAKIDAERDRIFLKDYLMTKFKYSSFRLPDLKHAMLVVFTSLLELNLLTINSDDKMFLKETYLPKTIREASASSVFLKESAQLLLDKLSG